ncbi:phosphoadenylyl-sulfate reductase [Botryobacter ruber]|uniref:phosphoadenylyl-sulfate reductase n=1 Tax=Botryobacter ruber TaxID=2171629 RepID=UPI000E0A0290|nr:phosphoadenylyl-sulfate reductase [Botryobacter ruber]
MSQIEEVNINVADLTAAIAGKSIEESLAFLAEVFPGQIAFSSSLGIEDQVITHFIYSNNLPIRVFTLDTGRLFNETLTLLHNTNKRYGKKIEVFFPQTEAVEKLVNEKGPMSFYQSVENRKECCYIRKVEPLNRALKGVKLWITGIRREQSDNRQSLAPIEWDNNMQLFKYNPLLEWTFDDVKTFVKENHILYNPLHDQGFVSIGCAPCTRAIAEGENFRAGRWWWEDSSKKECGLHTH